VLSKIIQSYKLLFVSIFAIAILSSCASNSSGKITSEEPFAGVIENPTNFYGKRSGDISISINRQRLNGSFIVKNDSSLFFMAIYSPFGGEIIRFTLQNDSINLVYGDTDILVPADSGLKKIPILGKYPFTIDQLTRILFGLPLFTTPQLLESGEVIENEGLMLLNSKLCSKFFSFSYMGRGGRDSSLKIAPIDGGNWKLKYSSPKDFYFEKVLFVGDDGSGFELKFSREL